MQALLLAAWALLVCPPLLLLLAALLRQLPTLKLVVVAQDTAMKAGALGLATGVVAWTARPGVAVLSVGHQRLGSGKLTVGFCQLARVWGAWLSVWPSGFRSGRVPTR